MNETDDERAAMVEAAAEAGAEVAAETFRAGIDAETKDNRIDFVTQADRDAQAAVIERIRRRYPDEVIVGEEEGADKDVPDEGPAWVIDPIDGTTNYVRGVRIWGTVVAAVRDGEPVASTCALPALGDTYVGDADGAARNGTALTVSEETDPRSCLIAPIAWWEFDRRDEFAAIAREVVERFGDLRRYGSAQATLAYVAAGALDGVLTNVETNPWDTVAGVHMIRQAGGSVTDLDGERWRHDSVGLVASNGADAVHEELLAAARELDGR